MNTKQRITHELYQRKVIELNEAVTALKQRQARCAYLDAKRQALAKVWNLEMAEAYDERILQHQDPINKEAKKVIKLRGELESMPRVWIA